MRMRKGGSTWAWREGPGWVRDIGVVAGKGAVGVIVLVVPHGRREIACNQEWELCFGYEVGSVNNNRLSAVEAQGTELRQCSAAVWRPSESHTPWTGDVGRQGLSFCLYLSHTSH